MHHNSIHPDGTRKRRFSSNQAKRAFYARYRSARFARHMGAEPVPCRNENPDLFLLLAQLGHSQQLDRLLADCDPADTTPSERFQFVEEWRPFWHPKRIMFRINSAMNDPSFLAPIALTVAILAASMAIGAIHHIETQHVPSTPMPTIQRSIDRTHHNASRLTIDV